LFLQLNSASPAAAAAATAASNAPRPATPGKTLEELTARLAKIDIAQVTAATGNCLLIYLFVFVSLGEQIIGSLI
jgi:hypothetical protein